MSYLKIKVEKKVVIKNKYNYLGFIRVRINRIFILFDVWLFLFFIKIGDFVGDFEIYKKIYIFYYVLFNRDIKE